MAFFKHKEVQTFFSDRRLFERAPIHRYLNCLAPFNPCDTRLPELLRTYRGLEIMLKTFVDEYPRAIGNGKMKEWQTAISSAADLYAHQDAHTWAGRPRISDPSP